MATRVGGRTGDGSGAPSVARSPARRRGRARPGRARAGTRGVAGCGHDRPGGPLRLDRRGLRRAVVAGPPAVDAGAPRRGRAATSRPGRGGSSTSAAARARWRPRRSVAGRRSTSTAPTCPPACSGSPSARAPALPPSDRGRVRFRQAPADRLPYRRRLVRPRPDVVRAPARAVTASCVARDPARARAGTDGSRSSRGCRAERRWTRTACTTRRCSDAGLEPREPGGGSDDLPGPEAAVAALRRAGFADATAHAEVLDHQFTPESFLAFIARFDDADQFESFEPDERAALEADVLARLRALPPDGLRLVAPIVYASGRRT